MMCVPTPECMHVHHKCAGTLRGQKKALDPLELVEVVVSYLI